MPHFLTVPATLPAQAQNCSGSCFDATFEYIASCTRTPARWAMGAARSRKGSSSMTVGLAGFHASVQRFCVSPAPGNPA